MEERVITEILRVAYISTLATQTLVYISSLLLLLSLAFASVFFLTLRLASTLACIFLALFTLLLHLLGTCLILV